MSNILELDKRISLIDGYDMQRSNRTGTYVIKEKELTLVETSASLSIPFLERGLAEMDISLEDIKYIILTHIHLDHAGGAGLFLQKCPNAKIVVHEKGVRHLVDPSRLVAGARAVYGEKFDELFEPVVPVPEDRIIVKRHLDTLDISNTSTLTFYNTPGHANHHLSIYDEVSNGMFAGDTVGIYYRELAVDGIDFYLPSTSPNQFDPEEMLKSAKLYQDIKIDRIYFGHFGVSEHPEDVYQHLKQWLPVFTDAAGQAYNNYQDVSEKISATERAIYQAVYQHLAEKGVPSDHPVFEIIKLDLMVSSMGLIDYCAKHKIP
ncbi:MBL fold metallo-hydrolase [Peribacillus sp. SCS-155]|uniref:MBL fold metallo-hydrolase n=1 Tax=Peribacillus sedimenti TaxID=3115297 RepID=UPI003906CA57